MLQRKILKKSGQISEGNIIHLEFKISGETIEYDGSLNGDEMKGKVKLGSMAEGTFSGKKKKTN
jgi:hypothetical protein